MKKEPQSFKTMASSAFKSFRDFATEKTKGKDVRTAFAIGERKPELRGLPPPKVRKSPKKRKGVRRKRK